MSTVLVNQKFYSELNKLGIASNILDVKNKSFISRISQTLQIPPILGMTISDADNVVRWTIDYTLGLSSLPQSILSTIHVPVEIGTVSRGGPVEVGSLAGQIGNTGPLGHIITAPVANGLITSAMISNGLRNGQAPEALNALKMFVAPNSGPTPFTPNPASTMLKTNFTPILDSEFHASINVDLRPAWERNPELYKFPIGFPRTDTEKQLSIQTAGLITAFKSRSDKIGLAMTQKIKERAPSWALPNSTNVNFADEAARFGYLKECDLALKKAQLESSNLVSDALIAYPEEAALFLAATKQYVFCTPELFQQYWEGQFEALTQSATKQLNEHLASQTYAVNNLKTQLSQLDFDQQRSQAAANQAQQHQSNTCEKIGDVVLFVGIVVVVTVITIIAAFGLKPDQYPNSGSYGPVNPNDPNHPDPTHPPGTGD
jgi:hypothetical protein